MMDTFASVTPNVRTDHGKRSRLRAVIGKIERLRELIAVTLRSARLGGSPCTRPWPPRERLIRSRMNRPGFCGLYKIRGGSGSTRSHAGPSTGIHRTKYVA